MDELAKQGYVEGENIEIDLQNAQGEQRNLKTISQQLAESSDVVLAIARPSAQSLANTTQTTPVIFSAEVLIHDLTIGGRLLSIGIGAIVYRLIILNIYEIPNLDQNLVRLFNAILLALVLFAPELQKRLKIRGLKLRNE
ncbi:ABC transporter permease [Streptococcus pneumoniae]|nr:ABC transporter permease [Streptococcus pneumoniae]